MAMDDFFKELTGEEALLEDSNVKIWHQEGVISKQT